MHSLVSETSGGAGPAAGSVVAPDGTERGDSPTTSGSAVGVRDGLLRFLVSRKVATHSVWLIEHIAQSGAAENPALSVTIIRVSA
jgi:hypothetical protein